MKNWIAAAATLIDETVIAKVTKITDMLVDLELLEYNNEPAFMLLSETSNKFIRSVKSYGIVGKTEPVYIISDNGKCTNSSLNEKIVNYCINLRTFQRFEASHI